MLKKTNDFIKRVIDNTPETKEVINSYRDFLRSKNEIQSHILGMLNDVNVYENTTSSSPVAIFSELPFNEFISRGGIYWRKIRQERSTLLETFEIDKTTQKTSSIVLDEDEINVDDVINKAIDLPIYISTGPNKVIYLKDTVNVLPSGNIVNNKTLQIAKYIEAATDENVNLFSIDGTFHEPDDLSKTMTNLVEAYQNNIILDTALESLNDTADSFTMNISDLSSSISHKIGELTSGSNVFLTTVSEILRTEGYTVMERVNSIFSMFEKEKSDLDKFGMDIFSDEFRGTYSFSGQTPVASWISGINIDVSKPISIVKDSMVLALRTQLAVVSGIWNIGRKVLKSVKSKVVETFIDPIDFIVNGTSKRFDKLVDVYDIIPTATRQELISSGLMTQKQIDSIIKSGGATDIILPFGRITIGYNNETDDIQAAAYLNPTSPINGVSDFGVNETSNMYFIPALYTKRNVSSKPYNISAYQNLGHALDNLFPDSHEPYIVDYTIKDDGYWQECLLASKIRMSYFIAILSIRETLIRRTINGDINTDELSVIDDEIFNLDETLFTALIEAMGFGSYESFVEEIFPSITPLETSEVRVLIPLFRESLYGNSDSLNPYLFKKHENGFYRNVNKGTKTTNFDLYQTIVGQNDDVSVQGEIFETSLLYIVLMQKIEFMSEYMPLGISPVFIPYVIRNREYNFAFSIVDDGKHVEAVEKTILKIIIVAVVVVVGIKLVQLRKSKMNEFIINAAKLEDSKMSLRYMDPNSPDFESTVNFVRRMERKQTKTARLLRMMGVPGVTNVLASGSSTFNPMVPFKFDTRDITNDVKTVQNLLR